MKHIKTIIAGFALAGAIFGSTSCNKMLDLAPIDYYGSNNFWKTEAQVDGYIGTLNSYLRNLTWNHCIIFGEVRGGLYKTSSASADGSTHGYLDVILQNFDSDHTGVNTFGGYYGAITQTNLFISRVEKIEFLPAEKKSYYLGIAYGIRAFLYFDLYRVYGAVPLRLDVAVIDGELDPLKLYMARNSPDEVIKQIKADIAKSLEYFGSTTAFDPYNFGTKTVWSKAATEYLAGEVYLWNAKVDVSDVNGTHKAEPADINTAETYFNNVVNNYGLSLQNKFTDIFSVSNKGNSEIIFAIRYKEDEASNAIVGFTYLSDGRGQLMNQVNADGTQWGDPMHLNGSGMQNYEYTHDFYNTFDDSDTRKAATFVPCYSKPDYDQGNLVLVSAPVCKNIGHVNSANVHVYDGDQPFYRLAGAYLALAEIANYKGNNTDVEKYINTVRERAYGANWAPEFKYTAGSFEENELAILFEKDKEYTQEGQRWWDLCRMTSVKGGAVTDHLAFSSKITSTGAVLKTSEAYKLLWPIDKTLLGNDPLLEQTVGY